MALNSIGNLYRLEDLPQGAVSVDGSFTGVTFEIRKGGLSDLSDGLVLPIRVLKDGKPVPETSTIEGTIPAGAILQIGESQFRTANITQWDGSDIVPDFQAATVRIPRTSFYSGPFVNDTYMIAGSVSAALESIDLLIAAAGYDIRFHAANAANDRSLGNLIDAGQIVSPRGFSSARISGRRITRYFATSLGGTGRPRITEIPLAINPFPDVQNPNNYSLSELILYADSPHGTAYLAIETALQVDLQSGQSVGLISGGIFPGGESPIWYELDSYNISETVQEIPGGESAVVQVFDANFTIRTHREGEYDVFDLFSDQDGAVWDIQGVERIDRSQSTLVCQRRTRP